MTDRPTDSALDGKRIFVAGAAGLAGSSVVRSLLAASPSVRVVGGVRGETGAFLADARLSYVRGDFRRAEDCLAMLAGCDAAVLTAANTGGAGQARAEPWRQVTDNLILDAQLLQACHDAKVRRVVYVGSATVYQDSDGLLAEDDLDLNRDPPAAHYGVGWAKRSGEKLCRFWHDKAGIDILVARAANIYGPGAKFDPASANVIPALIRKAVDGLDPFEVWGKPEVARDVLYSDDFGAGVVALLAAADIHFDIFNLGAGRPVTVAELVDWVLEHSGHRPSRVEWRSDRPTTARVRALDCRKIGATLGWRPRVEPREGIRRTVAWWRKERHAWAR